MPTFELSLETAAEPSSADVTDGSRSLSHASEFVSSYTLKLFQHQRIVTHGDRKDPTLRTPADPPIFTAIVQVFNILEVSTMIATYLLPVRPRPLDAREDEPRTHRSVASFGRVCTALYFSSMRVLYARVTWLPSIWQNIADSTLTLRYPLSETVIDNPEFLLYALRLQYNEGTIWNDPESVLAYKFRRLLFITAQVRALNIDNGHFSQEVFQHIADLLPAHRRVLLPGLRTVSWIDDEYLIPSFLSTIPDDSDSEVSPNAPKLNRSWLPFDPRIVRTINLQIHHLISPVDTTANQQLFYTSVQQLRNQCRKFFPYLDTLLFLICRNHYHKPTWASRLVMARIASMILASGAVALSANIPQPPATLPFSRDRILKGGFLEGIAVNGYISRAPVLNSAGETAEGASPPDAYLMVSAHFVTSVTALALSCTTNMTAVSIEERHSIRTILAPAMQFIGLETVILHLDAVSLRLSHSDLNVLGQTWKNLRTLDLRFKTIVTNEHLDIITIPSVQAMSKPGSADSLRRVHLPELDVRNFRNIMNHRHDGLHSLTSSVLYFNEHEVPEVCAALLAAYPSLTMVTGTGSAPGWAKFAEVLGSLREKDRVERSNRLKWVHLDAILAQTL